MQTGKAIPSIPRHVCRSSSGSHCLSLPSYRPRVQYAYEVAKVVDDYLPFDLGVMTNDDLVKGPTPFKKRHEPGNSGEGDQKRPRDERKERQEPKEIPKAFGEPKKSTV